MIDLDNARLRLFTLMKVASNCEVPSLRARLRWRRRLGGATASYATLCPPRVYELPLLKVTT